MKNILIAGGTGMIGSRLCKLLDESGYEVSVLSRSKHPQTKYKSYQWNVEKQYIEKEAIKGQDIIINLAGAGVADKPWTKSYKNELLKSRTDSTRLLFDTVSLHDKQLLKYISASAAGIYPSTPKPVDENTPAGNDFLAQVCMEWETEANRFKSIGIPVAIVRTGIVLNAGGGFLKAMEKPVKLGLGAALGSGKQHIPWIHIDDLCRIYLHLAENINLTGAFNAAAENPATNKQMIKTLASVLHKPAFLPNVPSFVLKLATGDMAAEILSDHNLSVERIKGSGFEFKYKDLRETLEEIYEK